MLAPIRRRLLWVPLETVRHPGMLRPVSVVPKEIGITLRITSGALSDHADAPSGACDVSLRVSLGEHFLQRVEDFRGRRSGKTSQPLDEAFAIDRAQLIQRHES